MPILALSLANLRIGDSDTLIDGPAKRKATCSSHYGLANDSSLAVRLVALSRLMRARDDELLSPAAQAPVGVAILTALRDAVRRVAVLFLARRCPQRDVGLLARGRVKIKGREGLLVVGRQE